MASDSPDPKLTALLRDRVFPGLTRVCPAAVGAIMLRFGGDRYLAPVPTPAGMTSRELVRHAVTFGEPPRIPYACISPLHSDFCELAGFSALTTDGKRQGLPDRKGELAYDEWGVGFKWTGRLRNQALVHPLRDLRALDDYRFPAIADPGRYRWAGPVIRRANATGKYVVAPDPVMLAERARFLMGFDNLLVAAYADPARVQALLARLTDLIIAGLQQWARQGRLDAFMTWDDWGLQTGPMVSPRFFREVFGPHYARIIDATHRAGLHFIWHCCGHITELIPTMIELGADVLQLDQPRLLGHETLAERFGGRICFWNCADIQWSPRPETSAADIEREIAHMVQVYGRFRGGLMLRQYPQPLDIGMTEEKLKAEHEAFLRYGAQRM